MFNKTTKCKDCGGLVSYKAKTCPHCGARKPAKGGTNVSGKTSFLVIAVTCVIIFLNMESFEGGSLENYGRQDDSSDPCQGESPKKGEQLHVTGTNVNARTGPGTNFSKFAIPFNQGEAVNFLCEKNGWIRFIDRDGNIGWMKSAFLRESAVQAAKPEISTNPGIFSAPQICKAGIAAIMGRDPGTMITQPISNGVYQVAYMRSDDGKRFTYKCKIERNRILWGNIDGRWRNHSADSMVTYMVDGDRIIVTDNFGGGSALKKQYSLSQIGD